MYSNSSQLHYWMFNSEEELTKLRLEAYYRFINEHKHKCGDSDEERHRYFLTPNEERTLIRQNETMLREFCRKFQPPMPRNVAGTAFQYFKRFYLNNSVMDFHPKYMLVTCVYLACKVEEFNVSISDFVKNVRGDREKAADIVLNYELLLMQQLKYHLTVHNPYRPIEGLMIDLKARCLHVGDPERFRNFIENFIESSYFTDACFLYSPSQIALAAIVYAATKHEVNLDSYLTDILFIDAPERVENLRAMMASLWGMIKNITKETPTKEQVKYIEKKLEKCRNEANNMDSQENKKQEDSGNDMEPMRKYMRLSEEQKLRDEAFIQSSHKK